MSNYNVQVALGPKRRESESLAQYMIRNINGVWDEKERVFILPSGTVEQGRRPMWRPNQ